MKQMKSLKSLVPADADAAGGLEVVSVRLNKGTAGKDVQPEFGINASPGVLAEDAGEADLDDIETFLTAVAAADTADIADTDDNADNANGWRGDASNSTVVHDSSFPSTPRKARRRSSLV